jgi:hypothetical protein
MKRIFLLISIFVSMQMMAQDSTMNSLTKDMENKEGTANRPVKIFNSEKLINANTTEVLGKGKMDFKVTHNFDDIAGDNGGIKKFFGLDNSTDVRIGFHVGLTDRLTISAAHAKGGGDLKKTIVSQLYELSLKYQMMRQFENDPTHPVTVTLFASNVISTQSSFYISPKESNPLSPRFGSPTDTSLNEPYTFANFGDRMSQVLQAIIAKKTGKISLLLNFTLIHQDYVPLHDQNTIFAIGGAIRVPLGRSVNLIVDYFHSFRSQSSKNYFKSADLTFNPPSDIDKNLLPFKFYDPLGVGFEIITAGHVFHLNFTNATQILESRLIPYTNRSWGKGEFRWGFNISRTFVLWREKK